VAVLWPSRLAGFLDGAPLDSIADAIVIGLALPAVVAIDRRVLRHAIVRLLIVVLLAWKSLLAMTAVADGWCVRFESPAPLFVNDVTVPHAWDVRADWRSDVPRCSAIMTRGYPSTDRFPAWFYNLPPANWLQPAKETERPPHVSLAIAVSGSLHAATDGVFRVGLSDDVKMTATIDGAAVGEEVLARGVTLAGGSHEVVLTGTMTGERWALLPQWNGGEVWREATATMSPPGRLDLWLRPWGAYVTAVLVSALLLLAAIRLARDADSALVLSATTLMGAAAVASAGRTVIMRSLPIVFGLAGWLRIPRRLQNLFGAQLLIGVPFLALVAARGFEEIGRITWYTSGDDWWMFQRYAYRIYLQGYWLEGGEPAFWFQPLYRWIAGGLHMIFGDSSVGELWWDGACAWAGALFAFHAARVVAGFRWGLAAATITLLVMTLGPGWYLFGRGLSELTSAGLIYSGALFAIRGRSSRAHLLMAGLCLIAGFYTRLNNLPFAIAVIGFSLPIRFAAGDWFRWRLWWPRCSRRVFAAIVAAVVVAIVLFSARTYYYTGSVNALAGTQASARSVWQPTDDGETAVENVIGSVLLVLTMNDPAKLDPRAFPIMFGVAAAILALAGVKGFRRLPLNLCVLCLAGVAGAFVARGSAYPGRFSIHLIPVTVALTVCAWSILIGQARPWWQRPSSEPVASTRPVRPR
jgi:hypothetical protein